MIQPLFGYFKQAIKDERVDQPKLNRHAGGHLPACDAGHVARGLCAAVLAHVVDHALDRACNGKRAAAGEGIAGVGGAPTHLTRGYA